MNFVDLALVILLVGAVFDGLRRGFFVQGIELVVFGVALTLGLLFYRDLGDWFVFTYDMPALIAKPLAFLAIWLIVQAALSACLFFVYRFVPEPLKNSLANRVVGLLPALVKTGVVTGLALTLFLSFPIPEPLKAQLEVSPSARFLVEKTGFITRALEKSLGGSIEETINFITTPADESHDESRTIPKVADERRLRTEENLERRMLQLMNEERARLNLSQLTIDTEFQKVARAHSRDMWLKGYFSHVNKEGQDPFDRLKAAGLTFATAGENLALAPSVEIAHFGLMRSPGHRDNILYPEFGKVGIGIISAGSDGIMVTQNFRD